MPSVKFKFELPQATVERMKSAIGAKQVSKALFQATKRTGDSIKKIVVENIREHSTVSRKAASQAVKSTIAHGDTPTGEIRVSAKPIPMASFSVRASKKGGVTVRVSPDAQSRRMPHVFKAKVGAGQHGGLFYRTRAGGSVRLTKRQHKPMVTPAGFVWRLPIKEVFGPSAVDMIKPEKVQEEIRQQIGAILEKNIRSQIDRFTKGKQE